MFSSARVDGGDKDVSSDGARCVLREDAALATLLAEGENATRGDFTPAVARKI
jgi:hypothetical protein